MGVTRVRDGIRDDDTYTVGDYDATNGEVVSTGIGSIESAQAEIRDSSYEATVVNVTENEITVRLYNLSDGSEVGDATTVDSTLDYSVVKA